MSDSNFCLLLNKSHCGCYRRNKSAEQPSPYFLWDFDSGPKNWTLDSNYGPKITPTPGRNVCVLKYDLREKLNTRFIRLLKK